MTLDDQLKIRAMEKDYIVLLVFVVGHDGDDGVVNEQAKREDSSQAWERRPG